MLTYVAGVPISMHIPKLLFDFAGLILDLACSLPEDGWTVDGICCCHQPWTACPEGLCLTGKDAAPACGVVFLSCWLAFPCGTTLPSLLPGS